MRPAACAAVPLYADVRAEPAAQPSAAGLLDRGDQARPIERWLFKVVKNVPVSQVAHAMISEAERRRGGGEDGVRVFSMGDILNM